MNEMPVRRRRNPILMLLVTISTLIQLSPTDVEAQGGSDIALDLGNDGTLDWTQTHYFRGPERTRNLAGKVDRIVYDGCLCDGCVLSLPSGQCTIPVKFYSRYSGNLTVNDVEISYYSASILANLSYGNSFREAVGDCWTIEDIEKTVVYGIPEGVECSNNPMFTQAAHSYPNTGDAIDDAVWRLLNQELDKNGDWRVDFGIDDNMSIQSKGLLGVQSLWGPAEMRLIVWV
jgi:hypothetical protein